jgi:hypothetical protein
VLADESAPPAGEIIRVSRSSNRSACAADHTFAAGLSYRRARVTTSAVTKGTPAPLAEEQPRDETRTVDSPLPALVRPPPADQRATGELLANRYEIGSEVGRGGGGTVYRAFDRGAQLAVALKLLIPHKWPGQQSSEQLYRELRFGRSIQHPNVRPVPRRPRLGRPPEHLRDLELSSDDFRASLGVLI